MGAVSATEIEQEGKRKVERDTAATVLSRRQVAAIGGLLLAIACQAAFWGWRTSLITVTAAAEAFYFAFVGFKVILAVASYLPARRGLGVLPSLDDPDLPTFTILLPNVKEKAHVLRALLESMANMEYPAEKLQVMLLVEHWDQGTLQLFGAGPADSAGDPDAGQGGDDDEHVGDGERIELRAQRGSVRLRPGRARDQTRGVRLRPPPGVGRVHGDFR